MTEEINYFLDPQHKKRFFEVVRKYQFTHNVYWLSAIYLVTADDNTESHMHDIFNFERREFLIPEVFSQPWITSHDIVMLAYAANLFNGFKGTFGDEVILKWFPHYDDAVCKLDARNRYILYIAGELRANGLTLEDLEK